MAFNIQTPGLDPSILGKGLPTIGGIVNQGIQGFEQGAKLKEIMQKKRFEEALTSELSSGAHDYKTPEGQASLVKRLAEKGFGPQAIDLANTMRPLLTKPEDPETLVPFDAGPMGAGTVGTKSGTFKPLTMPSADPAAPPTPVISGVTQKTDAANKAAEAKAKFEADKFAREQAETERHNKQMETTAKTNAEKEKAPKPPTADQSKVATFGHRIEQSMGEMSRLSTAGYDRTTAKNSMQSSGPSSAQDAPNQQQAQAERNFVNAVLRRESGAAISAGEFASAEKQYFPRWRDTPEVLAQKARNRAQVAAGFKAEAGDAWDKVATVGAPKKAQKFTKPEEEDEYQAWVKGGMK